MIKSCWGCKRFQALALAAPPPGLLPKERTEGSAAFEVVGLDFARPIRYRKSPRVKGKAYLTLYACSLSRALHLEVLPKLEPVASLGSLKRLVARCGRPAKIFSDNGRTFVGAAVRLWKLFQRQSFKKSLKGYFTNSLQQKTLQNCSFA